ncbi:rhomboid family intramembrane serine protease [Pedobacter sp. SD-b]|uniref:Rhomboid family intramembrane serine protease n=1 Tax=Pedobacter segetis TaxID=2793069 RepID=A0ABS1BF84_9SPHI|nr:rhomboid family intramembrane serine protease [Pedobacter segetis]MBK0381524.1 rhomboid family intramembrane serine protease [Pedobacter segetis]
MKEFRPLGNTLFPPVVKNLLIINGIMFFATYVFQSRIDLNQYLDLYYFGSPKFRIWQLVTHLFMHANIMHIFSNMFALWMFGAIIENYMGSKRFLQYYLLTGIFASVLFMGVQYLQINPVQQHAELYEANPRYQAFDNFVSKDVDENNQPQYNDMLSYYKNHPDDPEAKSASIKAVNFYADSKVDSATLGASGAVFGILLAFGMLFPNALIYIYFFFPMKAKYLVILYGAFELYNGVANNPGDNVAHFAHLGGMLIGFILLKIWDIKRPNQFG